MILVQLRVGTMYGLNFFCGTIKVCAHGQVKHFSAFLRFLNYLGKYLSSYRKHFYGNWSANSEEGRTACLRRLVAMQWDICR